MFNLAGYSSLMVREITITSHSVLKICRPSFFGKGATKNIHFLKPSFTANIRNNKTGYNGAVWWNSLGIGSLFYKHFFGSKLERECDILLSQAPLNNDWQILYSIQTTAQMWLKLFLCFIVAVFPQNKTLCYGEQTLVLWNGSYILT